MQLLVLILKKVERMNDIIKALAEAGVKGGTIIEGKGMAESLIQMEEDLPLLELLRMILSEEEKDTSQLMLSVLKEEQIPLVRETIRRVIGDLNTPNTGILFAVPISFVEGLGD